ncbi:hypothetical protein ACFV3T_16645 [Streptomyces albidoflavus]
MGPQPGQSVEAVQHLLGRPEHRVPGRLGAAARQHVGAQQDGAQRVRGGAAPAGERVQRRTRPGVRARDVAEAQQSLRVQRGEDGAPAGGVAPVRRLLQCPGPRQRAVRAPGTEQGTDGLRQRCQRGVGQTGGPQHLLAGVRGRVGHGVDGGDARRGDPVPVQVRRVGRAALGQQQRRHRAPVTVVAGAGALRGELRAEGGEAAFGARRVVARGQFRQPQPHGGTPVLARSVTQGQFEEAGRLPGVPGARRVPGEEFLGGLAQDFGRPVSPGRRGLLVPLGRRRGQVPRHL